MIDKKDILSVDTPWCIGCWACIWMCPELFKFNDESKSTVKRQPENQDEINCAKQAEESCPAGIIHVKD